MFLTMLGFGGEEEILYGRVRRLSEPVILSFEMTLAQNAKALAEGYHVCNGYCENDVSQK